MVKTAAAKLSCIDAGYAWPSFPCRHLSAGVWEQGYKKSPTFFRTSCGEATLGQRSAAVFGSVDPASIAIVSLAGVISVGLPVRDRTLIGGCERD